MKTSSQGLRLRTIGLLSILFCLTTWLTGVVVAQDSISVGANVNMVSGQSFPAGDPFQRQQNEPSVAYSSRNSLHLLSGANDYRAVDVPGLPGGRETGDSWLSYFWSTNGGATWKSTLMPGYPQDPACLGDNPPVLCDYAAGADPVVRAGVNGMFYYSGIVFDRSEPSRSAIFVSRFIDLNNDEGGDPIRYLDTVIIDANNDGSVFLDKSWIEVDIPRDTVTETISVLQRDGSSVNQTIACGNVYVGYAAIGGEGQDLRSEIRMATSSDCGNAWDIQAISETDTLNQGANIAIHPLTGEVHVAWRRFDTVESFLGISPTGCPASPSSWEVNSDWPVSSIEVGGNTYTIAQAQALLGSKHRGDESIKLAYEVIAAKLNLLTGGGDPVDGFNPWLWAQELNAFIDDAEAWFVDNPIGSDPKQQSKQDGQTVKKNIQEILQGSGICSGDSEGTPASSTGETNAIIVTSSDDLGETFSTPTVIDESSTFDQGSTRFSFRTTAYPTIAADAVGRIYVAWAARGYATIRNQVSDGDSRIVLSTSTDGSNWSNPYAVDEPNRQGHQIKPSLLFAGGQLTLVFYDFRQDVSNIFEGFVVDIPDGQRLRHTVDVRLATALPATAPVFTDYSLLSSSEPVKPSSTASRYSFVAYGDPGNVQTLQVEYMVPNYPMFADGTTPFIGDYVDVAAPNLINDEGTWRFASNVGDVQVWQAVWSDNRNVIPPPDGDWSKYVAPITTAQPSFFDPLVTIPSCNDVNFPESDFPAGSLYTGTRNQNVYSASISNGVIVAAPGNNRPLDGFDDFNMPLERSFVVYVQNTTRESRTFNVSLPSIPFGIKASLALNAAITTKDIEIPPYSSAVVTVFASLDGAPTTEAIPVSVVEVGGTLAATVILNSDSEAPDPLSTSLLTAEVHNPAILNPAILNPAILNATVDAAAEMTCTDDPDKCLLFPEVYNPAILNPAILNPAILNPAILNPAIFNPAILNPAIFNPAILNPAIMNPAIMNPAILNPAILNPAIFNPAIFNPAILNPAILNPAIMNPAILNPAILNPAILNPAILNPAILNPAILNPAILNTTVSEEAKQVDVTFAVVNEGNATTAYDLNLAAPQIEGLDYELFVYLLNETPVAQGCELTTEAQQLLVLSQDDPLNNDIDGSFYLEPGQQVLVTFRVLPDVDADVPLNPVTNFDVADLGGLVTAQPLNTDPATQPPADEFGPPIVAKFIVTSFDPSVVFSGTSPAQQAALNAAVGVTNYIIEDFEDLTLIPGLTTSGGVFGLNIASVFPGAIWDESSYYVDQVLTGGGVTFTVAAGTNSFGIGLGDIDISDVNLFVNGEDLGSIRDLPNWRKLGDNVRDVYIRIDAAPGESITSVQIKQGNNSTFSDGVFFDHVAFDAPPSIDSVNLSTSVLTIGGAGASYTATFRNSSSNPIGDSTAPVIFQAYIEQPGASRAAGGAQVFCGAAIGVLPPGGCTGTFSISANNTTSAGSGTLVDGPAMAIIELKLGTEVIDTITVPITLGPATGTTITGATPNLPAPGTGQLVTFTIPNTTGLIRNTDLVFARNDATGFTTSNNFIFGGTTVRLDGALRPTAGTEAGTVWVEYGNGDRSNDFPITFSATPAEPVINGVFTASACFDSSGTEIDPLTDTLLSGDWVRIAAQGLDSNTSRIDVLTTQSSTGISSNAGLCPSTDGSSYWVQIPNGVTAAAFMLQIRANQTNEGGVPGDYATINLNQ